MVNRPRSSVAVRHEYFAIFCVEWGTGMFSYLMTNRVILYGRHYDCFSGMRVVDTMPETLQTGATKSNMDGPRLRSQGSASQA